MDFARLAAEHPLRYLFLELTRRCNLRCIYCGSDCGAAPVGPELPAEGWLEVVEQIAQDFEPGGVMVAITGGEPLLAPVFWDLAEALHRHGFPFGMVSNGQLIDRACAERLAASGIGSISLSLDGPEAVTDALRGEGVSARVAAAIGHLHAAGYGGVLEVVTTLTSPVMPHLDAFRVELARLRVPHWRMVPVMPIGRAAERGALQLDAEELRQALEFVRRGRADGLRPMPEWGEEGYLGDELEGVVRPYRFRCQAGLTIAGILHDGRIGACPELGEAFVQGDLKRDRFSEVWASRYQVFRDRRWARRGACQRCDAWDYCQGGSLHLYPAPGCDFSRCSYRMLMEG